MIWLSPMAGTAEGSVYFEIRDMSLQRNGHGSAGRVSGLLGDGQREVWVDVQLGAVPQVKMLPVWTDEGQIESLSAAVDEEQLKQQLLDEVQQLFNSLGLRSAMGSIYSYPACGAAEKLSDRSLAA